MIRRVREDIRTVFERDPAAKSVWEVMTCYPGLQAIWMYRLAHRFWCWRLFWLGRFTMHLARWFTGIEIHPGASIGRRFFIDHGMGVVIGETTEIGDDVTLYHGVTLGGTTWKKHKRHPTLEDGVIVGAGAKILGPIVVGAHSRIGANSVLLREVPAHSTVVGIPGNIVTKSSSEGEKGKINLDHHLMPDPVADAIRHMLTMIDDVNARIDAHHRNDTMDAEEAVLHQEMEKEHQKVEKFLGGGGI
ncbi:MAG: serine O-acetyltransferase [Zetaproteobacteria bacterium]|nr:serine O-acetyltransferase [Zetaproteobacteria bacterium]